MERKDAKEILRKYLNGTCTEEERQVLEQWYRRHRIEPLPFVSEADKERQLEEIWASLPIHKKRSIRRIAFVRYAAAVVLLVVFAGSLYYYLGGRTARQLSEIASHDIAPGGNKATLTLADGRRIDLSTRQSGIIVGDSIAYADGSLVLDPDEEVPGSLMSVSTPKGGMYQVTLPDGTRVWINSASTLTYPSRFDNKERVVELTGEAYFEVAKLETGSPQPAGIPFLVISNGQRVEVLGTQFNISAYPDEPVVKTTLVEGSVRIVNLQSGTTGELRPGQQSIVENGKMAINEVDVTPFISWKNGTFYFDGTEMQAALRQLSRWYNLEVIYPGEIPETRFYGEISRDKKLSEVLEILQEGGIKFKIEKEGEKNRLTVLSQ